jgi:hypothetical protein
MDDELIFNYIKNFDGDIELWNSEENQIEFEKILDQVCEQYYKKDIIETSCTETQTDVLSTSCIETQTDTLSTSCTETQTEANINKFIKVGYNKALNFKT